MSGEVRYLTLAEVIGQHERLMREYGQDSLLMDEGKLESAVFRPQHAAYHEDATLLRQGALLVDGITQARACQDGNKRLALLAGATFLRLNGRRIVAERDAFARAIIEAVLRHEDDPDGAINALTAWLEQHAHPIE